MVEPVIRPHDGTVLDTAGMKGTGQGPAGPGGSPFPTGTPGITPASKEQAEEIICLLKELLAK